MPADGEDRLPSCAVIVLLPPSETKHPGGDGPPLALDRLDAAALNPLRGELLDEVTALAADPEASRRALGLSERQDGEIARNAVLRSAPTVPAIHRYTGVLYDALDVGSLRGAAAERARVRLRISSALFGLLRADDAIPAYRLSAGSKLPNRPTLAARWRPLLEPVFDRLTSDHLIIDLRSAPYAALARIPGALRVGVVAADADGRRVAISHANKSHKGRLARVLAGSRAEPSDAAAVAAVARRAGMRVEHHGSDLTVVVSG